MPSLPLDILRKRVKNEYDMATRKLPHIIAIEDPEIKEFPAVIVVTLMDTPGPIMRDGKIDHKFTHQFKMIVTKNYPYEKPIVLWQSEIFHPNLMLPEDGGSVCTKLLADWDFSNNLMGFIKGIEALLANPNPQSPWGTDTCTLAAQHFNAEEYDPPIERKKDTSPKVIRPKVREEKKEEEVESWD